MKLKNVIMNFSRTFVTKYNLTDQCTYLLLQAGIPLEPSHCTGYLYDKTTVNSQTRVDEGYEHAVNVLEECATEPEVNVPDASEPDVNGPDVNEYNPKTTISIVSRKKIKYNGRTQNVSNWSKGFLDFL